MSNSDLALHSEYLIKLLRASLKKEVINVVPNDIDLKKIYYLAKLHSVTPTVYPAIKDVPLTIVNIFKGDNKASWRKNAVQFVELSLILSKADEFDIDCIPLKGCVIKDLYPSPEMRTMADLDFLFDYRKIDDINLIMYALGYIAKEETANHYVFYKEPLMNVEFHPNFFIDTVFLASYFNPGWRYSMQTGIGMPIRKLTNEGFYIYLIAHFVQHFKNGGAGVRDVMDAWVFLNNYSSTLDWKYIDQEFKRAGIFEFSNNIYKLAEVWFGIGITTPMLSELGEFIIKSGTYGLKSTSINTILGADNKITFILKSVFPPYSTMKHKYSFIKKAPPLLPIGWIIRAFSILTRQKKDTKDWIINITDVNKESANKQQEMFARFGL